MFSSSQLIYIITSLVEGIVFLVLLVPPVFAIDFTICDPEISDQEISFSASLSGVTTTNCPDNRCYLQGVLRSVNSSKYFGETFNTLNNWVDYISSPDTEYIKANFYAADIQTSGWSSRLKMRFKIDDPDYQGPGNYDLKVRRYTGKSSSSYAESNTLNIVLTAFMPTSTPTPTPTNTPTPTPTPNPTNTPTPTVKKTPTPTPSNTPTPTTLVDSVATVAGVFIATEAALLASQGGRPTPTHSPISSTNTMQPYIISMLLVATGLALLAVVFVVKKGKILGETL